MAKKWIPRNMRRGAFTRKARAAGMSVAEYARHVLREGSAASGATRRQAALAQTLRRIGRRRRRKR